MTPIVVAEMRVTVLMRRLLFRHVGYERQGGSFAAPAGCQDAEALVLVPLNGSRR